MVGDLLIFLKRIWKIHVTCRHDYEQKNGRIIRSSIIWYECSKCGKTKKV